MKISYYYFFFLLFPIYLPAQSNISHLCNTEKEFSQNNIRDIIQDKYGFIWLATEKGLVRYDGSNFILQNEQKLSNPSFGNFYGSVEKDSIVNFNFLEKNVMLISNLGIKQILIRKENNRVQKKQGRTSLHFIKNNMPAMYYSEINDYFIALSNETYYFNNNSINYKNHKVTSTVKVALQFSNHDLSRVFMFGESLFFADPKKGKTIHIKNGNIYPIKSPAILLNPDSKLFWHQTSGQSFVIIQNKIYLIYFRDGILSLKFLLESEDLGKGAFSSILYDQKARKIFLASENNGLNIISVSFFHVSKKKIPYSDEIYYASLPYDSNSVITEDGWVYNRSGAKKIFNSTQRPDKFYLSYDSNKNLVYKGYYYITKRYKAKQYENFEDVKTFKNQVEGLFESNGTFAASLACNDKQYLHVYNDDSFQSVAGIIAVPDYIFSIYKYNKDLLYISCTSGLYLASISQKKIIKTIVKGFPVKHVVKTSEGNLWFTTFNHGIFFFKDHKARKLPLDSEENIRTAHYILEDSKGFLWISSNNGLFKAKKRDLLDYVESKQKEVTYFRYSKEHGFLNNEFNGSSSPCATKLENGEFVFPSMDGLVFFNPQNTESYFPESKSLNVNKILVDGNNVTFREKIILSSSYKKASVILDLPYYSDITNIYLGSKIEGIDKDWNKVSNDKVIPLDKLKPGNYTLTIRFLIKEGKFAYKKIMIKIEPQFYETLLFKVLSSLLFISIFLLIMRWRFNFLQLRQKLLKNELYNRNQELSHEKEKVKLTENLLKEESAYQRKLMETITHDISTPVHFIAKLAQKLSETQDETLQKRYFDSIYKSSEELYKFTQELRNYTYLYKEENSENEIEYPLQELIETKVKLFNEIAQDKQTYIVNFCCKDLWIKINKNIVAAIIHNLLDNAVKNTTKGIISINTQSVDSKTVKVIIRDTGFGMSDEKIEYYTELFTNKNEEALVFKKYGLGLHLVIKLVKKIDAKIRFIKNNPKGTVIELYLNIICNEKNTYS